MANTSWSIRPIQNAGIEMPAAATAVTARSIHVRFRTAAMMPAGRAAASASASDAASSSSDAGSRSITRSSTGRPSLKL